MITCRTTSTGKYIRIVLSVIIIGLGIYYKSWWGLVGVITLISAFTGGCLFSLKVDKRTDCEIKK